MTIEIIKRGTLPEEKKTEYTCNRCASVLGVARKDTTYVHDQRDGDFWKFQCPVCEETGYIYVWF